MQWMFSTECPEHQRMQILHTSNNISRNLGQFLRYFSINARYQFKILKNEIHNYKSRYFFKHHFVFRMLLIKSNVIRLANIEKKTFWLAVYVICIESLVWLTPKIPKRFCVDDTCFNHHHMNKHSKFLTIININDHHNQKQDVDKRIISSWFKPGQSLYTPFFRNKNVLKGTWTYVRKILCQ